MQTTEDVFLTEEQVAARIGVQPTTIKLWRKEGKIKACKISQRVRRYHWPSVKFDLLSYEDSPKTEEK